MNTAETVTENVVRTGEQRIIDPLMADGIVNGAQKGGYVVHREWISGFYMVGVYRPGAADPMLVYVARTD
jgi:hypothetical protein